LWDKEYPKPDLRFFWESTGERIGNAWRSAEAPPSQRDHGALPPYLRQILGTREPLSNAMLGPLPQQQVRGVITNFEMAFEFNEATGLTHD
jgi:hypothetical protein